MENETYKSLTKSLWPIPFNLPQQTFCHPHYTRLKGWQVSPFSLAFDAKQRYSKLGLAMCVNGREHPSDDSENHHNRGLGLIHCWCLKIVCVWGVGVLREIVVVLRSCWSTQTGEEEEGYFQVDTGNFAKGPEEAATISVC